MAQLLDLKTKQQLAALSETIHDIVFPASLQTLVSELRETSIGFKIAWELGHRNVHLLLDSLAAVEAINANTTLTGRVIVTLTA
ncbi:hypothetical protein LINPERPRIM_LOCUS7686 [Linum perenne]